MTSSHLSTLGERIAWARSLVNMSTKELDGLAELKTPTVHRIEHDDRMPGADSVLRIARVLGVTVEWLVDGTGDAPAENIAVAVMRARNLRNEAEPLKPTGTEGK